MWVGWGCRSPNKTSQLEKKIEVGPFTWHACSIIILAPSTSITWPAATALSTNPSTESAGSAPNGTVSIPTPRISQLIS